jgi:hypothetical protein
MTPLVILIQACRAVSRLRRRIVGGQWYLVTSRFDCRERWTRQDPDIHTMVLDREDFTRTAEETVQPRRRGVNA